jgi:hypothetical protein
MTRDPNQPPVLDRPTGEDGYQCDDCGRPLDDCACGDECPSCGHLVCTCDDNDFDAEDYDGDGESIYCYADKREGLCCDDLCHGAQRCMSEPRPWEDDEPDVQTPETTP